MCFAVPLKILKIQGTTAEMEDGRKVRIDGKEKVLVGDYVEVYADVIVNKLKLQKALEIRRLIKKGI